MKLAYELASLNLQLKLLEVVGYTTPVSKPASFHYTQKYIARLNVIISLETRATETSLFI